MQHIAMALLITSSFIFFSLFLHGNNALSFNYYDKTCPAAESTVTKIVTNAVKKDKTVSAALLRMHFHDCFIRVILLKTINLTSFYPLYPFTCCYIVVSIKGV